MCSTPSVERVSILNFSSVETGQASFHESTRRVPQASENMGNGQRHSSYPDEVGACEPRRREPTRVSIEIVREGAQTMGPDNAVDFCVSGTVRVRDVFLFSKVLMWKLGASGPSARRDHVLRRIKSSLPGGRDERDDNRSTARRPSNRPRLRRRALEIALLNEERRAQLGEEMTESAHRDELRDWTHGRQQSLPVVKSMCVDSFMEINFILENQFSWRGRNLGSTRS